MTQRLSEWRIRVTLHDGTIRAGRYIGAQDGHTYVMCPNTGEVHDFTDKQIANVNIIAPGGESL